MCDFYVELDIFSDQELPHTDVVIAADIMYDDRLGQGLGRRVEQLLKRHPYPPQIIVCDSQRFTDFVPSLQTKFPKLTLVWEERLINNFTGSGVCVDEDQTYNVTARVLKIGF